MQGQGCLHPSNPIAQLQPVPGHSREVRPLRRGLKKALQVPPPRTAQRHLLSGAAPWCWGLITQLKGCNQQMFSLSCPLASTAHKCFLLVSSN